jgi:MFS family permease
MDTRSGSRAKVRRLATARLISLTGSAAAYMALNFIIYQRTHSATWVAATLFLTFGTVGFASPFAGALGDRFDRKKVMIASDLAGAGAFVSMALVHAPWLLLLFAFLSAVAEAPFFSSSSAAIPNLVGDQDLSWANSMVGLGRNAGILVGPLLGGLLVSSVGSGSVFAGNAVSFVVSAALVTSIHGRFNEDRSNKEDSIQGTEAHQGLRAGYRFLRHDRILRTITLSWLAIVVGLGMTMVADVPLVNLFGTGSFGYGVLIACWGGGSIVGSLLGRNLKARTEPLALIAGTAVVSAMSIATGVSPWWVMVLVAIFTMGVGDGVTLVAEQGSMQRRTPDAVRSRVSGAFDSIVHVGMAISYVMAGPAVAWLGPRGVYIVGGIAASMGVAISLPILRSARQPAAIELDLAPGEATEPSSLLVP